MTTLKRSAHFLVITLFALALTAQAQTQTIEVSPDASATQAATQEPLAPTGGGTAGKLAKWTSSTALGNSVLTESSGKKGVHGYSATGRGVEGNTSSGIGVYGESSAGSGYAGYFIGKVRVYGALQVNSCTGCTSTSSDRALKAGISSVDARSLLDRLAALPINEWSYKTDGPTVRHVGPMAQDFRAAFNLGDDDKHIDLIDASGVTMAAVQALYRQNRELMDRVGQLEARLTRQQAQLDRVRRRLRHTRAAGR